MTLIQLQTGSDKRMENILMEDDFKMHLNKYNVIHIDIQWFLSNVKDIFEIVEYISQSIIEELRQIYPEHISTDENGEEEFDEDLVYYDFSNWWNNMDDIEQVKEYRKHE